MNEVEISLALDILWMMILKLPLNCFFFLCNVKRERDKNPIKDQCPKPS